MGNFIRYQILNVCSLALLYPSEVPFPSSGQKLDLVRLISYSKCSLHLELRVSSEFKIYTHVLYHGSHIFHCRF